MFWRTVARLPTISSASTAPRRTKIRVVYPGVDAPPVGDVEAVRRKYHLPERYFLFLGTLQPRKNIARIVQAYQTLARRSADDADGLVLAGGQGWLYDPAWTAGVDGVILTGYVDDADKGALYAGALALVFPSLYEGFGFPVLEAMHCRNARHLQQYVEPAGTGGRRRAAGRSARRGRDRRARCALAKTTATARYRCERKVSNRRANLPGKRRHARRSDASHLRGSLVNICVYCSASNKIAPGYFQLATRLGDGTGAARRYAGLRRIERRADGQAGADGAEARRARDRRHPAVRWSIWNSRITTPTN